MGRMKDDSKLTACFPGLPQVILKNKKAQKGFYFSIYMLYCFVFVLKQLSTSA